MNQQDRCSWIEALRNIVSGKEIKCVHEKTLKEGYLWKEPLQNRKFTKSEKWQKAIFFGRSSETAKAHRG
eukprot:TRINITY_DN1314_c0_g1_i1.p2 TRINITY_DN1314_c0_g1~~TRINITY_DN1314_c0_g1_i1.p2  ORF type:complete len:70 (-),score=19.58 TRINITY_DN1314_c0_g1_i1:2-211(-)